MNTPFSKRLTREIKEYETQKQILNEQGIYLEYDDSDLRQLKLLVIGPSKTPYSGGFYFFTINIPDMYPLEPPKVKFITRYNSFRFHPNLYVEGKVCLSILGTWSGPNWTPVMTIMTVALSIQSILTDNPLSHEPAYYNAPITDPRCQNYKKLVSYNNLMGAVIHMIKNIPHGFNIFQKIINKYFVTHFKDYTIDSEIEDEIVTCNSGYGSDGTTCKLDYQKVKTEFYSMLSILEKEG